MVTKTGRPLAESGRLSPVRQRWSTATIHGVIGGPPRSKSIAVALLQLQFFVALRGPSWPFVD